MNRQVIICEVCGEMVDENKLTKHIQFGHKEKREFKCDLCQKEFTSNYNLQYHMAHHINARNFVCNECPRAYNTQADLVQHQRAHEMQRDPYKCEECGMTFQIKSRYKTHLRTHKNKQKGPQECTICKKMFVCLSSHNRIVHMNLRNYKCTLCDKKFGKESGRKRHLSIVHEKQKNFMCNLCDRRFGEKAQLKKHKQVHLSVKDATFCSYCKLNFEKIKEHYEQEHKDLQYRCKRCYKRFLRLCEEKIHKRYCPVKFSKWFCNNCDESFPEKNQLKRHIFKIHQNKKLEEKFSQNITEQIFVNILEPEIIIENENCYDNLQPNEDILINDLEIKDENYGDGGKDLENTQTKLDSSYECHHKMQALYSKHECEICQKVFSFKSSKNRHLQIVHYNKKIHKCKVCDKSFGTRYDLNNHFNHYHNENPNDVSKFHCKECKKNFISSSAFSRHLKGVHFNIKQNVHKNFHCGICHETISNKYQKEKHMAQVHLDGKKMKRTCGFCKMQFQFFEEFKNHIESHEDVCICIVCGKSFTNPGALSSHFEGHKKIGLHLRRFICDLCGHRLFNKIQLNVHMRKHVKESNFYICDECGQSYKFIAPFLYHKKLHSGKREYTCTYCSKEFLRKQDLIIHTRQHTNEKPFSCTKCKKRFSQKQVLAAHLKTHSAFRMTFKCTECKVSFTDKIKMRVHDEKVHPEKRPFMCLPCKMSFRFEHNLKIHRNHKHKTQLQKNVED